MVLVQYCNGMHIAYCIEHIVFQWAGIVFKWIIYLWTTILWRRCFLSDLERLWTNLICAPILSLVEMDCGQTRLYFEWILLYLDCIVIEPFKKKKSPWRWGRGCLGCGRPRAWMALLHLAKLVSKAFSTWKYIIRSFWLETQRTKCDRKVRRLLCDKVTFPITTASHVLDHGPWHGGE